MRIRNNKSFNVSVQGQHLAVGKGIPPRINLVAGAVLELDDAVWEANFANCVAVQSSIESGAFEIVKAPAKSEDVVEAERVAALKAAEKLIADNKVAEKAKADVAKSETKPAETKPAVKPAAK